MTEMRDGKYQAVGVLGEGCWEIEVFMQHYETYDQARKAAMFGGGLMFAHHPKTGEPAIACPDKEGRNWSYCTESDVRIREIKPQKQQAMGRPLDVMGNKQDLETAQKALWEQNSAYIVTQDDMMESNKTLAWFLEHYRSGYEPDYIAYSVHAIDH